MDKKEKVLDLWKKDEISTITASLILESLMDARVVSVKKELPHPPEAPPLKHGV